jgi:hypothetical protein
MGCTPPYWTISLPIPAFPKNTVPEFPKEENTNKIDSAEINPKDHQIYQIMSGYVTI